jgi:hypothetical protein
MMTFKQHVHVEKCLGRHDALATVAVHGPWSKLVKSFLTRPSRLDCITDRTTSQRDPSRKH